MVFADFSLFWLAPGWILVAFVALLLIRPLLLAAKRSEELDLEERARFAVELALVEVERHWRSRGRRFFESGQAWLQLADELFELGIKPGGRPHRSPATAAVHEARRQAA